MSSDVRGASHRGGREHCGLRVEVECPSRGGNPARIDEGRRHRSGLADRVETGCDRDRPDPRVGLVEVGRGQIVFDPQHGDAGATVDADQLGRFSIPVRFDCGDRSGRGRAPVEAVTMIPPASATMPVVERVQPSPWMRSSTMDGRTESTIAAIELREALSARPESVVGGPTCEMSALPDEC